MVVEGTTPRKLPTPSIDHPSCASRAATRPARPVRVVWLSTTTLGRGAAGLVRAGVGAGRAGGSAVPDVCDAADEWLVVDVGAGVVPGAETAGDAVVAGDVAAGVAGKPEADTADWSDADPGPAPGSGGVGPGPNKAYPAPVSTTAMSRRLRIRRVRAVGGSAWCCPRRGGKRGTTMVCTCPSTRTGMRRGAREAAGPLSPRR
jgi:hypothetical protein